MTIPRDDSAQLHDARTRLIEDQVQQLQGSAIGKAVYGGAGGDYDDAVSRIYLRTGPFRTDLAALDPDLARKVVARERSIGSAAYLQRRNTTGSTSIAGPAAGTAVLSALTLLLVVSPAHSENPAVTPMVYGPLALVSALILVGRQMYRSRADRDPLTLSPEEFTAVRQARARITPDTEIVTLQAAIDDADAITITGIRTIDQIRSSPAWHSEHLDIHRIQLDLDEELFQVVNSCNQLRKLSEAVESATPDERDESDLAKNLTEQAGAYRALRDEARAAIIARIVALHEYRTRLSKVEGLISNIERAAQAVAGNEDVAAAFTAITRDRAAAERTRELSAGLDDLRQRLTLELDFIQGQVVSSATLGAPLVLAARAGADADFPTEEQRRG